MRSDRGGERSRNRQLRGDDGGTDTHGGVAESTAGRVGGIRKHRSVLDCPARGAGRARFASAAGGYTATGAGARAGQKDRPDGLRVDSAAAQLRITAGFVSTGGSPQLKPYVHSCVCRKQQHGSRKAIVHWRGFPKFSPRSESTNGQPGRACSEGWGKEMTGKHEIEGSEGNRRQLQGLPVIRRNVAGIDLGSERHWVCAPTAEGSAREIASFGATTAELIRMAEWLKARQVESVALESTGVYWIARTRCWKGKVCKCCWWIHGNWRGCPGGTKRQTRRIASGFSGCTVADYCRVRFDRRKQSACCGRWCGIRPTWWRSLETGYGGCKRASTR